MNLEKRKVEDEPCRCVYCSRCGGTGNIRVSYDRFGRFTLLDMSDGMWELEPCEDCRGGITEVCDWCQLLEEMDQDDSFDRYLGAT